jgi:hypothetical protein
MFLGVCLYRHAPFLEINQQINHMLEEILKQLEKIEGIVVTTLYHNDKITEIKISELERVSQ